MSSLSTGTMDKTLRNKYDFFQNPFHYYTLLFLSVTIRGKIYECERKGSNTAPVQKQVNYENMRRQNAPLLACTGLRSNEIR